MCEKILVAFLYCLLFVACKADDKVEPVAKPSNLFIERVTVNGKEVADNASVQGITPDSVVINIRFTTAVDVQKLDKEKIYISNAVGSAYEYSAGNDEKELNLKVNTPLKSFFSYKLYILEGDNLGGVIKDPYQYTFTTALNEDPKFPEITDEELLTKVQQQTFRYFWDYAHPVSGLARERLGSEDIVTSGGSGFGLMTIPVGIERGFITRAEGLERVRKIVNFLDTQAEKFHGAFSHWLNGSTGKAKPFSTKDDGGDLVETAFLIQGLLIVQEYFNEATDVKAAVDRIWQSVEWDWYCNNTNKLYWHWSPKYNFEMNMPVTGYNEGLILYVLAASSPTHPISKEIYDGCWAQNGAMRNGKKFYDIVLPLGFDYGGPLFFSHYSFLGMDPRGLQDAYANYWDQNVAHSRINYSHCVANPKKYTGYGANCWGLTASDTDFGYAASEPSRDYGVIAPTAALSSFPYTPEESMKALHFFYYTMGDLLWGEYGFKDAFNLSKSWVASSYLAIDQGPIVVMIENHRTQLLWNLFMKNQDVQGGLRKLGFTSPQLGN